MLKTILPTVVLFFLACCVFSCSGSGSFEGKVKKYMKDSLVPNLNDPSSYEFVSAGKPDTVYNHKIVNDDLDFYNKMLAMDKQGIEGVAGDTSMRSMYEEYKNGVMKDSLKIVSLNKELSAPDYIGYINCKVTFSAKNAMGALVLNETEVRYHPANDSLKTPEYFASSKAKPAGASE